MGCFTSKFLYEPISEIKKKKINVFLLVQSCGHIDASLLSTASQKLSGHVRKSGEQVE